MCVTSFVILEGIEDAKCCRPNLECEPSRRADLSCYERSRRTKKLFDICLLTCTCLQCCQNTKFVHLIFPLDWLSCELQFQRTAHAGEVNYPRGPAMGLSQLQLQCSDPVEAHRRGEPRNLIHFLQRSVRLDGKDTHGSDHRVERVEELAIAAGRDVKVRGIRRVACDNRGRVKRGQCAVLADRKSGDVGRTGERK